MPEVKVGDQVIYYEDLGSGPKTVVLLPGYLGTAESDFGPIFPLLNKTDFRWICWDPPGYGKSRPQDVVHDEGVCERFSDFLGKFMKELGCDKYSVVGWSQGGGTAIIHSIRSPKSVEKVVFWGPATRFTHKHIAMYRISHALEYWPKGKLEEKLKYFDEKYLRRITLDMSEYAKRMLENNDGNIFGDIFENVQDHCPTLIMHGSKDTLVDESHPRAHQKVFKDSRLHFFPEGGHDLHLQFPSDFVQIVEEFLLSP